MNKKVLSLVLALCMAFSCVVAMAAPSPSVSPTIAAQAIVSSNSTALPAAFTAALRQPSEATEAQLALANKTLDAINVTVQFGGSVVSFFGEEVQAEIAKVLPAGMAAEDLALREFFPMALNLMASLYDASYGDIIIPMEFATEFKAGEFVAAVLGVVDAQTEEITWMALDAATNADGLVEITLTADAFALIGNNDTLFAILA